jgi:hypothetical protein
MGDDSIDMVILHIDMGYLVTLPHTHHHASLQLVWRDSLSVSGARAKAWCLSIHAKAFLSLS